jgi:TatD DNase family protein
MIDSHCHLADTAFDADVDAVLLRAKEAGVEACICIADSLPEAEKCIGIAEAHPSVFCTAGVHPHVAKEWKTGDEERLKTLSKSSSKIRAIGEIGLDYHYDFSPREVQRDIFRRQLELACELGLPAVVHCREAVTDVRAIIEESGIKTFVIHCCTEKWEDVSWVIDRGGSLSFTGIATYKNAEHIREVIRQCPLERLMIETDAPYLAPVPYRGKRNEPAFVVEVAKLVGEVKGLELEEIAAATTENAREFFGI